MLDLGWTEIMLIAGIAVLVISPKDLPGAMRTVGNWVGKIKRMASGFQRQFNEAIREAELGDIKKDVEKLTKIDPLADVRKSVSDMDSSLKKEMADTDQAIKEATEVKPDDAAEAPTKALPSDEAADRSAPKSEAEA
ncbi:MAG: Sec-independent protein translocase protein TatB [Alphaproteobacteria bacterium]